jgi:dCMP deaminase
MKKGAQKAQKPQRPSWDDYFLDIVDAVGSRATCDKGGSGCVIANDNRIVATGYTGSLSGLPHCNDVGHDIQSDKCMRTIHAEHNAITQALKFGTPITGATMYCESTPCKACAKMAESLGIKRIVVKKK